MTGAQKHSDAQPYANTLARRLRRLSRGTSPFLKVFIVCATSSLAIYICADLAIDWRPVGWGVIDRMILVIKCGIVAVTPAVLAVVVVAAQRLRPDRQVGRELKPYSPVDINTRIIKNTVEQFVLFFVGISGMSVYLLHKDAATIPILTGMFVLGRTLFWIGYHKQPYVRAFGFGLTFYPTVIVVVWVVLRAAFGIYVPI
ncbi:MAG: MAPEG family protein [Hyphomicrobiaceae bacterium]|nr:MAPEG family protein [Hyphomicrobiaceae bacterium]